MSGTYGIEAPFVFLGMWLHLEGVLAARYSSTKLEVLADTTLSFSATDNSITSNSLTPGTFAPFVGLEGFEVLISGATTPANNSGPTTFSRIVEVQSGGGTEKIRLDSSLHALVDEAAGAPVSLRSGFVIKNGVLRPEVLTLKAEEALRGEEWVSLQSTAVSAVALGNKLVAPPGTFSEFAELAGEIDLPINIVGFGDPANTTPLLSTDNAARIESVTTGANDEMVLSGIVLADEAAGAPVTLTLGGSYFSGVGLLAESLSFNWSGGGLPQMSANYQVREFLASTTRSRGTGVELPADGEGSPAHNSGRHLELMLLGGHNLTRKQVRDYRLEIANGLEMTQGGGSDVREDATFDECAVTGSLTMKHRAEVVHDLYDRQLRHEVMPLYQRWRDPLGNVTVVGIPALQLYDGFPQKGDREVTFQPNYEGKEDPLMGSTIFVQHIPA